MSTALVAAVLAGCAGALLPRHSGRLARARAPVESSGDGAAAVRRFRVPLGVLAALGGVTLVGPPWGLVAALLLFAGVWSAANRVEPAAVRRQREQARRDLPHVVHLLALALSSGASVPSALRLVEEALPASTAALRTARGRLDLGLAPQVVWSAVAEQPGLAPLGRTLVRAEVVGASPAAALAQLADELADLARADVEDRARAVGIRAALPLGLCLLPAFLLIGIVPLVVSALSVLRW